MAKKKKDFYKMQEIDIAGLAVANTLEIQNRINLFQANLNETIFNILKRLENKINKLEKLKKKK